MQNRILGTAKDGQLQCPMDEGSQEGQQWTQSINQSVLNLEHLNVNNSIIHGSRLSCHDL